MRADARTDARLPGLLVPVLLVTIIALVGASVLVRSEASSTVAERRSAAPGGSAASGSGGSSGADPRTLPSPDVRAQLPSDCRTPAARPFAFETTVSGRSAMALVVRCGGATSAGPLLYVAGPGHWQPVGRLGTHDGAAAQAFSGPLTGPDRDEFGIAWRRPDGVETVSLYRWQDGLREYWDSSSIGLGWTGARFRYEASADPESPGRLIVDWPDLLTGTPNCPACPDHDMYRDTYRWDAARPEPVLVLEEHVRDGLGPT